MTFFVRFRLFFSVGILLTTWGFSQIAQSASLTTLVSVESFSSSSGGCQLGDFDSGSSSSVTSLATCNSPGSHAAALATGSARAVFGDLGIDLGIGNNVSSEADGNIAFSFSSGLVQATSVDFLTVTNGPASGFLRLTFSVPGSLTLTTVQASDSGIGESVIGISLSVNSQGVWSRSVSTSGTTEFGALSTEIPYSFGTTSLAIGFSGIGRCPAAQAGNAGPSGVSGFECVARANFFGSAFVTGLDVLDFNQTLFPDAIVTAESGFNYQAGFSHTPTIPEPSTILLWGTGLAGLIGWRVKTPNMCRKRG